MFASTKIAFHFMILYEHCRPRLRGLLFHCIHLCYRFLHLLTYQQCFMYLQHLLRLRHLHHHLQRILEVHFAHSSPPISSTQTALYHPMVTHYKDGTRHPLVRTDGIMRHLLSRTFLAQLPSTNQPTCYTYMTSELMHC